jgi:hypothetical protein
MRAVPAFGRARQGVDGMRNPGARAAREWPMNEGFRRDSARHRQNPPIVAVKSFCRGGRGEGAAVAARLLEGQMMKLRETEFFRQLMSVIAGGVLSVATVAFVTIPYALSATETLKHFS